MGLPEHAELFEVPFWMLLEGEGGARFLTGRTKWIGSGSVVDQYGPFRSTSGPPLHRSTSDPVRSSSVTRPVPTFLIGFMPYIWKPIPVGQYLITYPTTRPLYRSMSAARIASARVLICRSPNMSLRSVGFTRSPAVMGCGEYVWAPPHARRGCGAEKFVKHLPV